MEEEIDGLFHNTTVPTPSYSTNSAYLHSVIGILLVAICWTAILLDILAIWTLHRNKCLLPRTNTMLLLWYLHSALFLLSKSNLTNLIPWKENHETPTLLCLTRHVEPINQILMSLFVILLFSHTAMTTEKLSTLAILCYVYTFGVGYFTIAIVRCYYNHFSRFIEGGIVSLLFLFGMTTATLIKDVNRCCRNRSIPLRSDAKFRLDIARLYIYNAFICFVILMIALHSYIPTYYILYIMNLIVYIPPYLIFIYTYRANEVFRKGMIAILRCNFKGDNSSKGSNKYFNGGVETCSNEDGIVVNFRTPETA